MSLRKRGWETLVYRVAAPYRGQARVVVPDELSDRAVAAAVASSPRPTAYSRRARGDRSRSYGAATGEEAGDSRDVQVSHARNPSRRRRRRRRARLTKKRHSLPLPSRAHRPPACVLRSGLSPTVGLRTATTDAHTLERFSRSRARGFRPTLCARATVLRAIVPPPPTETRLTRHESTLLRSLAAGERVIGSRTPPCVYVP